MSQNLPNMLDNTIAKIREMVDVNSVVGDPITTADGVTIIPISKVSFGYVTAGGDLSFPDKSRQPMPQAEFPFAGGSGAGVSVQPVGFLVVSGDSVRMLPAQSISVADRMVELLPGVVEDVKHMFLKPAPGQGGAQ